MTQQWQKRGRKGKEQVCQRGRRRKERCVCVYVEKKWIPLSRARHIKRLFAIIKSFEILIQSNGIPFVTFAMLLRAAHDMDGVAMAIVQC